MLTHRELHSSRSSGIRNGLIPVLLSLFFASPVLADIVSEGICNSDDRPVIAVDTQSDHRIAADPLPADGGEPGVITITSATVVDVEHGRLLEDQTVLVAGSARGEGGIDLRHVARSIAHNAAIQEGELVWIYGGSSDVEFMEKLAVAVAALGGQPLVSLFSDVTMRDWYRDVPERFDTMRDDWRWQIHQNADVVFLLTRIDPATYDGIASERLRAYGAGNSGLWDVLQERGVRIVWIGNGAHPSEWSANMFGIEQSDLESIYWKGMASDRELLAALGDRFREILHGASTVRVQHPNGTDITVGVAGQRIVVADGSFSPTRAEPDPSTGFYETWLPGGEVTLGVDPESAEGRLVLERFFLGGQDVGPTTLTFSGGRLLSLESGSDLSLLRELTQSALPMSERLTGLKFGVNPDITDERILPWMGAGMVSPTLGSNLVLGGDIDLPYGPVFLTLSGSTIHVDDQIVVDNGVLKL